MTTTYIVGTQLRNEDDRLHTPDTMASASVHACSKKKTASRGKWASWCVSLVILTVLQREATCLDREVDKLQVDNLKQFLKLLLTVLQRDNTRLAKEVDKLEAKLWQAMDRADLDSQEVGRALKETKQAKQVAAAAENRRKEVQGQLDELQPQLQVSLLSLHVLLQQPLGRHRASCEGWSRGRKSMSLACCSAVPTLAPVSSLPLPYVLRNSIVKACQDRAAARLNSTSWRHLRVPQCAHAWQTRVCTPT